MKKLLFYWPEEKRKHKNLQDANANPAKRKSGKQAHKVHKNVDNYGKTPKTWTAFCGKPCGRCGQYTIWT
ncbi:MAG: hypothetical protein IJJ92_08985 [Clostridia bacterium]|nr:hypothetical protein [Clostridia bacterium]